MIYHTHSQVPEVSTSAAVTQINSRKAKSLVLSARHVWIKRLPAETGGVSGEGSTDLYLP